MWYDENGFGSGENGQQGEGTPVSENSTEQSYSYNFEDTTSPEQSGSGYQYQQFQPESGGKKHNKEKKRGGEKKHRPVLTAFLCAILFGLVGGGIMVGMNIASGVFITSISSVADNSDESAEIADSTSEADEDTSDETQTDVAETTTSTSGTYTVQQVAEKCKSSVVAVTKMSVTDAQYYFGTYQVEQKKAGSGVIVGKTDTELLIATNNHVVEDADSLTVCFNDDENAVFSAQIKGKDSENDIAVIVVNLEDIGSDVLDSISIATLGSSDSLSVGDSVVAIGNALGAGQSVTSGIVSALDRNVTIDGVTSALIQTDAAINPGNSGGGLFNLSGELVGINSSKYSSESVEGMGFAIPMSKAESVLESLMNEQTRTKLESGYGYLNIKCYTVDETAASQYNLYEGVYVKEATEGGAAANAGMQAGDIIVEFDGKSMSSVSDLTERLQYYAAGETVEVKVMRMTGSEYKEVTLLVTLDNATEQATESAQSSSQSSSQGNSLENFLGGIFGSGNQ